MNCALKMISFLALIALVASFPASQSNAHDQLAPSSALPAETVTGTRSKRAIIFRPLFVYRQQQIQKQRLQEERQQKATSAAAAAAQPVPAGSNYAPSYYYNKKNCNC